MTVMYVASIRFFEINKYNKIYGMNKYLNDNVLYH